MDYSRQWATRIWCEQQLWPENYFVTLTYNPESLPQTYKAIVDKSTGELIENNSLVPTHLTKFMKDLREYFRSRYDHVGIRFYGVGEYGDQNGRPHYHICLFNLPLPPDALEPWYQNELHQMIYKCPLLDKIWSRGFTAVGELTWNSAAYVARYMLKKQKGENAAEYYAGKALVPEFSRMSRDPGIGRQYYEMHKESMYRNDELYVPQLQTVAKLKPPRYFDRLYDLDSPEALQAVKDRRREASVRSQALMLKKSTYKPSEVYANRERSVVDRAKGLFRALEGS